MRRHTYQFWNALRFSNPVITTLTRSALALALILGSLWIPIKLAPFWNHFRETVRFTVGIKPQPGMESSARPKLTFTWAGEFHQGLAAVSNHGKFGYIDTSGALKIPLEFEFAGAFGQNRAPVQIAGKWGYTDATGKLCIPAAFNWAGTFYEGRALIADSSGYTFIDSSGAIVGASATERFDEAGPFSEGWAPVKIGEEDEGAWGFVRKDGKQSIPSLFPGIKGGFSEGLAAVCVGIETSYRVGYIDTTGGFAIDTLFDAGEDFSEGLAAVGIGQRRRQGFQGNWGYADVTGKLCIPQQYTWAGPFIKGRALVHSAKTGWMFIDRQGRTLVAFPRQIMLLPQLSSTLFAFRSGKCIGFMDEKGKQVITPDFLQAGRFQNGLAPVQPNNGSGLWSYINENGVYLELAVNAGH